MTQKNIIRLLGGSHGPPSYSPGVAPNDIASVGGVRVKYLGPV